MRVLLMNSSLTLENDPYHYRSNLPPLGIVQIASVLREGGHEVEILDNKGLHLTRKRALQNVIQSIRKNKPGIIGISCIATRDCYNTLQIARDIKEIHPEIPLVSGGTHPTFDYEGMLDVFDFVVRGEGELTLLELVNALENDGKLEDADGLCYKENGEIKVNRARAFIEDLDSLPFPARDLLPNDTYKFFGLDKNVTAIETSRGCPFKCNFCCTPTMWGNMRRCKSAEKMLEELRLTYEQGFRGYFFIDDNFTIHGDVERATKICEGILKEKMDISWACPLRADTIVENQDFIELASKSGMKIAFIGYESASKKVLKDVKKGGDPSAYEKVYKILRRNRITAVGLFILGSTEEETLEDMDRTIELSKKICDVANFGILVPRPGTGAYIEAKKKGEILTKDWNEYSGDRCIIDRGPGPKALDKKWFDAYFRFYLRPKKFQEMFFSMRPRYEKQWCRMVFKTYLKRRIHILKGQIIASIREKTL